jgi:hypothetical protein
MSFNVGIPKFLQVFDGALRCIIIQIIKILDDSVAPWGPNISAYRLKEQRSPSALHLILIAELFT